MWSPFCNPFVFTFMHVMGVCTPPPQRSDVQICKSKLNCSCGAEIPIRSGRFDVFPIYPLCFHILAHSFALFCTLQKLKSFHFKRFRTLCQKYRGWGYPPSLEEEQNENSNCRFRRSIPSLATSHFRRTSGRFGWDGGKEGASARKNHWMGCREVTGCNSFQPWSASWT